MSRAAAALAAVAATGCWTAPRAPDGTSAIPGAVWQTSAKPFFYEASISAVALDRPHGAAVLALGNGDVVRVDLATGRVRARARRLLPDFWSPALLHLADGRWLVAGSSHGGFAAFTLDDATLEPSPVPVRGRYAVTSRGARVAQLADGRVVMSGAGIRFAAYDPRTWRAERELEPLEGYAQWSSDGRAVYYVDHGKVVRDALDGHGTEVTGQTAVPIAGAAGTSVRSATVAKGARTRILEVVAPPSATGGPGEVHALPIAGTSTAISADGTDVATIDTGALHVFAAGTGAATATIPLGATPTIGAKLALDAEHAVIASGSELTVVDLRRRAVASPEVDGPRGSSVRIAVADDGRVLVAGGHAWRLDGAGAHAGASIEEMPVAISAPGEVGVVGVLRLEGDRQAIEVRDADTGAVRLRLEMATLPSEAWIAGDAVIATPVTGDELWHRAGDQLELAVHLADSAIVEDVDPGADLALVGLEGTASVVELHTGSVVGPGMPIPSCDVYGNALLERGGHRAVTQAGRDVFVWDRRVGELEATLRAPEALEVGGIMLVPGHDEVLVEGNASLTLWSIRERALRTLSLGAAYSEAVSPDGKRLALVLADGRTALIDLDAVRAALPAERAEATDDPPSCGGGDVVAPPPTPEPPPCSSTEGGD